MSGAGGPPDGGAGAATTVRVRRTGGFAGRTVEGSIDLRGDDERATTARELVARIDLTAATPTDTHPDAFSYTIEVGGRSVTVPDHHLTDDQRALAELVLGGG